MLVATIRTIGRAEVGEEIGFNSTWKLKEGDEVALRETKPSSAPVYGAAEVKQVHRDHNYKYTGVRIR